MKNILILIGLFIGIGTYQPASAQVNVNINISSQPLWGPTGYDYVTYYYLPDLDIYYYVPYEQWIYFERGRWITSTVLPPRYAGYDLYNMYKVVINEPQPYLRNVTYRNQYAAFRGRHDQPLIRDSRDSRYYVVKNHPMQNQARNVPQAASPRNNGGMGDNRPNANNRAQSTDNRPNGNNRAQQNDNRRTDNNRAQPTDNRLQGNQTRSSAPERQQQTPSRGPR